MHRILIVDDEQMVLNALQRELRDDYIVESFISPVDALKRCQEATFDLVIADYQMPGMNGIQFLTQFGQFQPDAVRLILSGEADFDALVGSINEAHIYRFLGKPWDETDLAVTLAEALVYHATSLENRRLVELHRNQSHSQPIRDPDKLYQVLVVDDEANVLSAVRRDLMVREPFNDLHVALMHEADPNFPVEQHDYRFNVHIDTSPQQALERAKQVAYDVIISDYLMPEMDGLHFLDAIRQIQPDAIRILFSGQSDKKVLVKAINDLKIYSYIGKPWREYVLKRTVSQAISYRNLQRENRRLLGLASE